MNTVSPLLSSIIEPHMRSHQFNEGSHSETTTSVALHAGHHQHHLGARPPLSRPRGLSCWWGTSRVGLSDPSAAPQHEVDLKLESSYPAGDSPPRARQGGRRGMWGFSRKLGRLDRSARHHDAEIQLRAVPCRTEHCPEEGEVEEVEEPRPDGDNKALDTLPRNTGNQTIGQLHTTSSRLSRPARAARFVWRGLRRPVKAAWAGLKWLGSKTRPQGPGVNDCTLAERVFNIGTCLPFFYVATNIMRQHAPGSGSHNFGKAFVGVGFNAAVYHASSGIPRCLLRKFDYWGIALASHLLRVSSITPKPGGYLVSSSPAPESHSKGSMGWWRRVLSVVWNGALFGCIPFKPTITTSTNFAAVEIKCLLRAVRHPSKLLFKWMTHASMLTVAGCSFFFEDAPLPSFLGGARFPFMHAVWHTMAAATISSSHSLLGEEAGK